MSRVVLYRCPACKRTFLDEDRFCMCSGEDREPEPVEFIPASVARGLVEALTACVKNLETYLDQEGCVVGGMQPIKKAKAALAAAEEALK